MNTPPPPLSNVSEDLFHQVVESSPNALVIVDRAGRIVLVNAQTERLFGYGRDQLLGQRVEILVPERFRTEHPAYREGFAQHPTPRPMGVGRDLFGRRQDGSEFPVEIGLNPIDTDEGALVLASIVDITERKRMEERFRRVVEYAPGAMVMVDAKGRVVLANAQSEHLFGYSREELLSLSVEDLVPDRFRPQHPTFRHDFIAHPQPRPMGVGRDLFARRKDGSEFPVEIGLNPIDTDEGLMVLATIVDITERRRTRQRLESALQEKTVLLNEVHHRVKNNLQVISSLLNLQSRHLEDNQARAILNESQNRVRAMALTHQLLYERKDFSHIDLGEYLQRLAQLLVGSYRGNAGRVNLRLDAPPARIALDFERAIPCGLVVNELAVNALKHGFPEDRSGEVVVQLAQEDETVLLAVEDNGVGLPPDFDLNSVQSLGLQLVPLLVDQLQGELEIRPRAPTRFELRFPLNVPQEETE